MLGTKEKWYAGWERDFPESYVNTVKTEALLESLEFFDEFMKRQEVEPAYEVLNAQPGHGKTTALKIFIKKNLENQSLVSGLIVLREKKQMKELEAFTAGYHNGVLYIDSENYHEVKPLISNYQFVIITHERMKNLILNAETTNHLSLFQEWGHKRRVIIIDEAPVFVDSAIFELGKGMNWLDDCFKAGGHIFTSEQQIMIRSLIQILLASEFIQNKETKTSALLNHLDSESYRKVLKKFFEVVENHVDRLNKAETVGVFHWFKKLLYQDGVGYLDNGYYSERYSDHKKIICSRRIDYRKSGCSILILDGTASYTPGIYNGEYKVRSLVDHTKYERIIIHQRRMNTSIQKRKSTTGSAIRNLVARDLQSIKRDLGVTPFPLMSKFEIKEYLKLNVISKADYENYFKEADSADSVLPINLLNTTGKNYLLDQNGLYLTALPNRTASYYKAIAISLYDEAETALSLSMEVKDKEKELAWFADRRIEKVYLESLLAEIFQIISRSNIRNLSVSPDEKVHIFIATNYDHIVESLMKMLEGKARLEKKEVERDAKFEFIIEQQVKVAAKKILIKKIKLPAVIGKITDSATLKDKVNKNWHDPDKRAIITNTFQQFGLKIYEETVGDGKLYKKVNYLEGS